MLASPSSESPWKQQLKDSLRSAEDLVDAGLIARESLPAYRAVLGRYRFALPRYYASLIDRNDPRCPIRLQALPAVEELAEAPGLVPDPLGDLKHQPAARVTHRYPNRALLHLTPNCSMYCRFCFRKSLLNELSGELFVGDVEPALRYFATHPEIEEVIFSGGDPLMVSDEALRGVVGRLNRLPLKRLRFHTRVPVTFPDRVTAELAQTVAGHGRPTAVVVHFNHPREITDQSAAACRRLAAAGARVLNQSVLLANVNDDVEILAALSERLFEIGVLPYYLHHPDRTAGTSHFDLAAARGLALHEKLRERLPGYLVPRYVVDDGNARFKRNVADCTK